MSSTRSKFRQPKYRVSTDTKRPASWRKKCSTSGATGSGWLEAMARSPYRPTLLVTLKRVASDQWPVVSKNLYFIDSYCSLSTGHLLSVALFRSGLLASGDDFHHLQLLAVDGLVDIHDNPVVALDEDFVAALDFLAAERAAFFLDALEFRAGTVAGGQAMGDRAAQAANLDGGELLLSAVVAD